MKVSVINIHQAKTHLSRLVDQAVRGEPFVIAKSGVPLVNVSRLTTKPQAKPRRLGFLTGKFSVPKDFDSMGATEIEKRFRGR
jgi:antitoxin (DNA-binding transcriptional repressor) of toxin-antitoxin stability system